MNEPSEAVKAMARGIADKFYPRTHPGWIGGEACALAAILETQRLDAELTDRMIPMPGQPSQLHGTYAEGVHCVATAIRTGNHYAKDHSNDR